MLHAKAKKNLSDNSSEHMKCLSDCFSFLWLISCVVSWTHRVRSELFYITR